MKRTFSLIVMVVLITATLCAQKDHIGDGLMSVAAIAGESKTADSPQDSAVTVEMPKLPLWVQPCGCSSCANVAMAKNKANAVSKTFFIC